MLKEIHVTNGGNEITHKSKQSRKCPMVFFKHHNRQNAEKKRVEEKKNVKGHKWFGSSNGLPNKYRIGKISDTTIK